MAHACPKCKSSDVKIVEYMEEQCIVCPHCGYNECDEMDAELGEKTSQKAKGEYSPYKSGGRGRSQ